MKLGIKLAAAVALGLAGQASAVTLLKNDTTQFDIYGYVKADLRHVSGDIAYRDFWIGAGGGGADVSTTHLHVQESRLGIKVNHEGVLAVVEIDFYGQDTQAAGIVDGFTPRLRHGYIKTGNWLIGQTWSTFMPLHTLAETLDFGGAHVGEPFIRQSQIRYTNGGFSFAVEDGSTRDELAHNAETDRSDDLSVPNFIGRYDTSASWGQLSAAVLVRKVDQQGINDTAVAANVAAKFNVGDKNDIKVQVTAGEYGRYAGTAAVPAVVVDADGNTQVEDGVSFNVSYRQWWNDTTRTTIFYGQSTTDIQDRDRSHFGINLITNQTAKLKYGVELGQYNVDDNTSESSTYAQFSAQYAF